MQKLISAKHDGFIKIITGIRRCGKSYLLNNIFCNHLHSEGIDDAHIIKVDLENRRKTSQSQMIPFANTCKCLRMPFL